MGAQPMLSCNTAWLDGSVEGARSRSNMLEVFVTWSQLHVLLDILVDKNPAWECLSRYQATGQHCAKYCARIVLPGRLGEHGAVPAGLRFQAQLFLKPHFSSTLVSVRVEYPQ